MGALVLVGGEVSKKIVRWGGASPLWETLYMMVTLAFNELNIRLVPTLERLELNAASERLA